MIQAALAGRLVPAPSELAEKGPSAKDTLETKTVKVLRLSRVEVLSPGMSPKPEH